MLRYASLPAFTPMIGSHAATSAGTHSLTVSRHAATSSGVAWAARAMGVCAACAMRDAIHALFDLMKASTSESETHKGADMSTCDPSRAIRRFTFFTRLRTICASIPSTTAISPEGEGTGAQARAPLLERSLFRTAVLPGRTLVFHVWSFYACARAPIGWNTAQCNL